MASQEPIQGTPVADVDSSDTDVDSPVTDVDSPVTDVDSPDTDVDPPVTAVDPPNKCESWKSAYAQRLTPKKMGEEFDYVAREFQSKSGLRGPEALLYALRHACNTTNPDDLRDDEEQVKELPKGSIVPIHKMVLGLMDGTALGLI